MTDEKKKICRRIIEEEGWHKLGIIEDEVDVLYWNKEIELLYEDMDGEPCRCIAVYECHPAQPEYFRGVSGCVRNARMGNVIAWRPLTDRSCYE